MGFQQNYFVFIGNIGRIVETPAPENGSLVSVLFVCDRLVGDPRRRKKHRRLVFAHDVNSMHVQCSHMLSQSWC